MVAHVAKNKISDSGILVGPYGTTVRAIEKPNIDLAKQPRVPYKGGVATIRSIGITTPRGEVLIPTVNRITKKVMSDSEAIRRFERTGEHLGVYGSRGAADLAASILHLAEQNRVGKKSSRSRNR